MKIQNIWFNIRKSFEIIFFSNIKLENLIYIFFKIIKFDLFILIKNKKLKFYFFLTIINIYY